MQTFFKVICSSFALLDDLLGTSDEASSAGGNETDLVASGGAAGHGRGVTDVLVVTTTVRMLDRVHGDTSDARPVVSLRLGLVPAVDSLEERLVLPLATGANADHGSADALDGLPLAGRELDSRGLAVVGVTDDDGGGAGSSGEGAAVTLLGLDVSDDGTLRHLVDGENVANGEGSFIIY